MGLIKYVLLGLVIAALLFPIYWMGIGSLQNIMGIYLMPPRLIPLTPSFENYEKLLKKTPFLMWTLNTLILTSATALLSVGVTAMAGYAFSVYRFKGRTALWWLFLASLMIPRQSLIISMYVICRRLGISGLRLGAIYPLVFAAFHILLFRAFVDRIPGEMIDSARMDGAGEMRIILKITLPLCRPIIGALLLFKCVESMGDYLWQSLVLQADSKKTLLVGLLYAVSQRGGGQSWINVNPLGMKMTAGMVLFVPLLTIFVFSSRYFISGITAGGLKE